MDVSNGERRRRKTERNRMDGVLLLEWKGFKRDFYFSAEHNNN
jgi:hypothetical protein